KATTDGLTGLLNKRAMLDCADEKIHASMRFGRSLSVLVADIDHFKNVNDTLGHPVGDKLLRQVAERLMTCVREDDTVARLGGDEFTLILESIRDSRDIVPVAQKILEAIKKVFHFGDQELFVTASIGISVYPDDGSDSATLLKNADSAMYRAKDQGRNNYQFYTKE
ncbi:diguanylate cyclase domain-containing protein, partial [Sedimenticola sp.]|uniref:diguanylate cyclase domain-containing protein n=1 Tax=Sedimenticola sp. TaxID=1940285 RepID=UPI003D0DED17